VVRRAIKRDVGQNVQADHGRQVCEIDVGRVKKSRHYLLTADSSRQHLEKRRRPPAPWRTTACCLPDVNRVAVLRQANGCAVLSSKMLLIASAKLQLPIPVVAKLRCVQFH
jgi:hypothetical protein